VATRNLNRVIDQNYYPIPEARRSNMRHRPIGIGVQGLADAFILMRLPFDSRRGAPAQPRDLRDDLLCRARRQLRGGGARGRVRDLRRLAGVARPAADGHVGAAEPYTSNIYTRRVLAGEFAVVNRHLLVDLVQRGLWTPEVKNEVIARRGSVQGIAAIPADLQAIYKTVWEIKQRALIDMAADRGIYIDQSQSFNVHVADPTFGRLTSMHFYAWKKGLKTGMYYLRTRAATDAIQFTVDRAKLSAKAGEKQAPRDENSALNGAATEQQQAAAVAEAEPEPEVEAVVAGEVCRMEDGCLTCGS
jgi:ribonucleoside-diphosphate reductase subunit M1